MLTKLHSKRVKMTSGWRIGLGSTHCLFGSTPANVHLQIKIVKYFIKVHSKRVHSKCISKNLETTPQTSKKYKLHPKRVSDEKYTQNLIYLEFPLRTPSTFTIGQTTNRNFCRKASASTLGPQINLVCTRFECGFWFILFECSF